jgi:Mn-dependent DtxR family transcriptional regulator
MTVAAKDDELRRLADKSLDGQLLWELQNGFELSPRESQGVLEAVKLLYSERPEAQSGKVSLWVVKRDASVGKPLDELEKIQVWVTLHAGQEDLETYESYGHAGLRRQKILRITEEILDQHGVATQEDLARLLGTSIRTVRRDIAYLLKQGQRVVTRGVYSDIGPSVSHKVVIVEMFLSGFVYTEICRKTQHSAKAVKRYVQTFGRVVALYERGLKEAAEIARYAGISERLATEYLELYSKQRQKPGCRERIKDLLTQLPSRPTYPGADKTGMKKGAVGEAGQ